MIIILQLLIELYCWQSVVHSKSNRGTTPRGGRVIPYMGYIAMCCPKGYGFTASGHKWGKGFGKWALHPNPFFFQKAPPPPPGAWYNIYLTYVVCFTCKRIAKMQTKSRFLFFCFLAFNY